MNLLVHCSLCFLSLYTIHLLYDLFFVVQPHDHVLFRRIPSLLPENHFDVLKVVPDFDVSRNGEALWLRVLEIAADRQLQDISERAKRARDEQVAKAAAGDESGGRTICVFSCHVSLEQVEAFGGGSRTDVVALFL